MSCRKELGHRRRGLFDSDDELGSHSGVCSVMYPFVLVVFGTRIVLVRSLWGWSFVFCGNGSVGVDSLVGLHSMHRLSLPCISHCIGCLCLASVIASVVFALHQSLHRLSLPFISHCINCPCPVNPFPNPSFCESSTCINQNPPPASITLPPIAAIAPVVARLVPAVSLHFPYHDHPLQQTRL